MMGVTPKSIKGRLSGMRLKVVQHPVMGTTYLQTVVDKKKKLYEPKQYYYYDAIFDMRATGAEGSGRTHRVVLRQYSRESNQLRNGVTPSLLTWIHCSCESFTFFSEVALTRRGSSAIVNSNGKLPVFTNPKMIPLLCKHCLLLVAIKPKLKYSDKNESITASFKKIYKGRVEKSPKFTTYSPNPATQLSTTVQPPVDELGLDPKVEKELLSLLKDIK